MDGQAILKHYKKGEKARLLKRSEKDKLISLIKYPFYGQADAVELVNSRLALLCELLLSEIKVFPSFIPVFIDNIHKTFLLSISDPGTPIGSHTADSISQQATQALLNTFHQAGTSKPGGSQGIKENIRISPKRTQIYSVIFFRNSRLTFKDVLNLKKEILGINIKSLIIDAKTMYIDIGKHIDKNIEEGRNIEYYRKEIEKENFFWYRYCKHDQVKKTYERGDKIYKERMAIRLKLDVNKLVELKVTTCDIANKISERIFAIAKGKSKAKEDTRDYRYICFPSPTIFGIIDCFLSSSEGPDNLDYLRDYFLQQSLAKEDFKDIYVCGIEGIENYYPVSKNVTSCIRSIEPAYNIIIDENGKKKQVPKGTWVYFKEMRFNPVPISRFISLCESCGIKHIKDEEAIPLQNLEYKAYKINLERRIEVRIEAYSRNPYDFYRQFRRNPYYRSKNPVGIVVNINKKKGEDYEKYFPETIGIKSGKYYIVRKYEDGIYLYGVTSDSPNHILREIEEKSKKDLMKMSRNYDEMHELFGNSYSVSLKFIGEKKYEVQEFITLKEETMFEEISREIIGEDSMIFISNFEMGTLVKKIEDESPNFDDLNSFKSHFEGKYELECIRIKYMKYEEKVTSYVVCYKYSKYEIVLKVNREEVNNPKTYHSLNSVINSKYCSKLKGIKNLKPIIVSARSISEESEQRKKKAILLDTFLPFRKTYVPGFDIDTDDLKKSKEDYNEREKMKPLDRLIQFLDTNCSPEEKEYVYVETKGSSLAKLCLHKLIDPSKTYSNVFNEILDLYGIEALRNLIEFDLGNVINISGYINPIYISHTADVLTSKGRNPFTAKGIASQGTGPLSIITFNKVEEGLKIYSQKGKVFNVDSTSTDVLIGNYAPLGTGYPVILVNKEKLDEKQSFESNSEYFKKMESITSEDKAQGFNVIKGKFPKNPKTIRYIKKELKYYQKIAIDDFVNARMGISEPQLSNILSSKFNTIKIKIEVNTYNVPIEDTVQEVFRR